MRARRSGWSSETDRAFHDALFASQDHDAFSPAYTGNITIRRFADLASPRVEGSRLILDVGSGLGEITCELAGRFPGTRFLGVDHSAAGIAGARRNATRLGARSLGGCVTTGTQFHGGCVVGNARGRRTGAGGHERAPE